MRQSPKSLKNLHGMCFIDLPGLARGPPVGRRTAQHFLRLCELRVRIGTLSPPGTTPRLVKPETWPFAISEGSLNKLTLIFGEVYSSPFTFAPSTFTLAFAISSFPCEADDPSELGEEHTNTRMHTMKKQVGGHSGNFIVNTFV